MFNSYQLEVISDMFSVIDMSYLPANRKELKAQLKQTKYQLSLMEKRGDSSNTYHLYNQLKDDIILFLESDKKNKEVVAMRLANKWPRERMYI